MRIWCLLSWLVFAVPAAVAQSSDVPLITSDIENFWRAYEASTPGNRTEALQRIYLDAASAGLQDFVQLRIGSAAQLAAAIERYSKFYATIAPNTRQVDSQRELIQFYFGRFRGLYPPAEIPPVYFLIGRLSSGGTLGRAGLYIGTEVFSLGGDADSSQIQELNPAFHRAMGSIDSLPLIVVHEAVHAQLRISSQPNLPKLLLAALVEGAADYITNLVSGRSLGPARSAYAEARRKQLFEQFAKGLIETPNETSNWLYNYASVTGDTPADLGYWIGEEICRDYFTRAQDKQAALNNIFTMADPEAIMRQSSYAWLLPPKPQ